VSSILEALRELESDATPLRPPSIPIRDTRRRRSPVAAVAGVLAVVVAGGGALYFVEFRPRQSPSLPAATPTPAPPAPARVASATALPPAAPATVPPAVLDAAPPRAQVATGTAPAAPTAAEQDADTTARPLRRPHPTRVVMVPPAPPLPTARPARQPGPPRPAGEPRVDVRTIDYVTGTGHRTATLSINGDSPVIVHEGETIGGLDVQLILPDRVYLRHSGQIFAVDVD
jgi:hypothetical protein